MKLLLALALVIANVMYATAAPSASFAEFDRKARAGGEPLTVVFFGGSLTYGANASNPEVTSWRGLMMDYLLKKYPKTQFRFVDGAIGGSGSMLGQFRLQRDVMSKKPDLVFYDFMVNDGADNSDVEQMASYEGTLRKMIGAGIPVVQEFLTFKYYHAPDAYTKLPRYGQHKQIAAAYKTAPADVLFHICNLEAEGKIKYDELWPLDGAHPFDLGYQYFFECIRDAYEKAVADKLVCVLPEKPVFSDKFHNTTRLILADLPQLPAGWKRHTTYRTALWYDGLTSRWMGDIVAAGGRERPFKKDEKSVGQVEPLKVEFTGTMVGIFYERAGNSLSFKVLIDGKPVLCPNLQQTINPSEVWSTNLSKFAPGYSDAHLFGWFTIDDKLQPGKHTLEILPIVDPANPDGSLHIESVCFAGE